MELISRKEIIDRLERVIQNGVPSEDGMHPISAETVLEVVRGLSEHGTNLAEVGTDCISRDDVLRIVDYYGQWNDYHGREREAIEQLPPIQPEIVRCKDCKHRDPEDKKCDCGHDILWQLPRRDDWFCADGER